MRRLFVPFIVVLALGLLAVQAFCYTGGDIKYGTATIDGDLSDWDGADWNVFDRTYHGNPIDFAEGAWSARWTADKIYFAVKVRDTAHSFTDSYIDWASRDAVELLVHTTGVHKNSNGVEDYKFTTYQEAAREWTVGVKNSDRNSVWGSVGYSPGYTAPRTPGVDYVPGGGQFRAAGHEAGEWLYYEAFVTPYQYFGDLRGLPTIVSPLSAGMVIGLDVAVVGNNGLASPSTGGIYGYTGMKTSGHAEGGWYDNYSLLAKHTLLAPVPEPGSLIAMTGGLIGLAGFAIRRRK